MKQYFIIGGIALVAMCIQFFSMARSLRRLNEQLRHDRAVLLNLKKVTDGMALLLGMQVTIEDSPVGTLITLRKTKPNEPNPEMPEPVPPAENNTEMANEHN